VPVGQWAGSDLVSSGLAVLRDRILMGLWGVSMVSLWVGGLAGLWGRGPVGRQMAAAWGWWPACSFSVSWHGGAFHKLGV
jgi:hypothetical protein